MDVKIKVSSRRKAEVSSQPLAGDEMKWMYV